jgi:hypothetical protein
MEINQRKCKHSACKCIVGGEAIFCSPYCERRADEGDETCECGHSDCETSIVEPVPAIAAAMAG